MCLAGRAQALLGQQQEEQILSTDRWDENGDMPCRDFHSCCGGSVSRPARRLSGWRGLPINLSPILQTSGSQPVGHDSVGVKQPLLHIRLQKQFLTVAQLVMN